MRWLLIFTFWLGVLAASADAAPRTFIIDPGHGGHDRGGVPGQRISEKQLTLDVSLRLNRILRARGYRTVMTRTSDVFIPLPQRVALGNRYPRATFVSIHFNSAPREGACGFETFYFSGSGRRIAANIQRRLLRTCRTENRGIKQRGFYVLRRSRNPAVLVECGFLTNRLEGRRALQAAHRQRLAEAIAAGLIESR